jgi:hypothetical protein
MLIMNFPPLKINDQPTSNTTIDFKINMKRKNDDSSIESKSSKRIKFNPIVLEKKYLTTSSPNADSVSDEETKLLKEDTIKHDQNDTYNSMHQKHYIDDANYHLNRSIDPYELQITKMREMTSLVMCIQERSLREHITSCE